MMNINYTEQSRIFKDFRSIPYTDYYYLIRYYEQYRKEIGHLTLNEHMIMSFYYINALFETKEYNTLISPANRLLESSIIYNIDRVDGVDIYTTVLYQKTYAHLELGGQKEATKLSKQLVGISSDNPTYVALLRQCYICVRPRWMRPTLVVSAMATLVAAIVLIIFAALGLYKQQNIMLVPYSLLLFSATGLLATAIAYYIHVESPVRQLLNTARAKKKSKTIQ